MAFDYDGLLRNIGQRQADAFRSSFGEAPESLRGVLGIGHGFDAVGGASPAIRFGFGGPVLGPFGQAWFKNMLGQWSLPAVQSKTFSGRAEKPIVGPSAPGGTAITLEDIRRAAVEAGLDEEAAQVAMAIAQTEGGLNGAVGDLNLSPIGSHGPFQFYGSGGMLNVFAAQHGMSLQEAADYVRANPYYAATWALRGYLGRAIREGQAKGLRGAELATYAQRYGQRSVAPERAGANYARLFGG